MILSTHSKTKPHYNIKTKSNKENKTWCGCGWKRKRIEKAKNGEVGNSFTEV